MGGTTWGVRPATAVLWRGVWTDPDTAEMLDAAAARTGAIVLRPIQGSWSTTTSASSLTHAGAAVLDLDLEGLTEAQCRLVETAVRSVGGWAWIRPRRPGVWQAHLHLGRTDALGMHPEAEQQRDWYLAGLNGLWGASQGPDTGARSYVNVRWMRDRETLTMPTVREIVTGVLTAQIGRTGLNLAQHLDGTHKRAGAAMAAANQALAETRALAESMRQLVADELGAELDTAAVREAAAAGVREAITPELAAELLDGTTAQLTITTHTQEG